MALNLPQIVEKLLDTVNAGKVVTEVGSGLALAVPLLMLLSLGGRISVLPADRVRDLATALDETRQRVLKEKQDLRPALQYALGPDSGDLQGVGADALYSMARREIAGLGAHVEVIDAQIAALLKAAPIPKDEIKLLIGEKVPLATRVDRLVAQKEVVEGEIERQRALENQLADARSFATNVEVFSNNIMATIAFSIVLGVVLGQVSRLLFVNLLFDRFVVRSAISPAEAVRRGFATQQAFDDLIRGYYRFAEGSINMVAPTFLFGVLLPLYARARLTEVGNAYLWTTAAVAVLSAAALVFAGFFTYREYRRHVNDLSTPPVAAPVVPPGTAPVV